MKPTATAAVTREPSHDLVTSNEKAPSQQRRGAFIKAETMNRQINSVIS